MKHESPVTLIRQFSRPLTPLPVDLQALHERFRGVPSLGYENIPFPVILFDLYGTLFQSASGEIGRFQVGSLQDGDSMLEPLKPFLPLLPKNATLKTLRALFRQEVEKRHEDLRTNHQVPEVRVEEIWASILRIPKEEAFEFSLRFELAVNPVYPMPGARDYVAFLREKGIRFGLVSNAQAFTPFYMEALLGESLEELGFLPELTVFSYEWEEAKPSLKLFQMVAEKLDALGYSPDMVLYMGNDLQNDVWAPQQVGFRTALFCGDGRSLRLYEEDPRFAGVIPDYLVESFERGGLCM